MTQLSYNEAFDPYHTVFRFLRLNAGCKFEDSVPFDLFRILDFYLLFPFRLQSMKLHNEDIAWRNVSKSYSYLKPYGDIPEDTNLFSRMEPIQRAAASSLARSGITSSEEWKKDQLHFLRTQVPENLSERIRTLNESMSEIINILCQIKERYPLLGRSGLKDRSGLLEYRYDAI